MSRPFALSIFFRQTPNHLLRQYFEHRREFEHIPWERLKQTEVDPLLQAWQQLAASTQAAMEQDFLRIWSLASARGTNLIMQVVDSPELKAVLSSLKSHYERAMWLFLNPLQGGFNLFESAYGFAQVHEHAFTEARCLSGLQASTVRTDAATCERLSKAIRELYLEQGRVMRCRVDHHVMKGPARHYFTAYPEDHSFNELVYETDEELATFEGRMAFHVNFIYHPAKGRLEVYSPGNIAEVRKLQQVFCRIVLERELTEADLVRSRQERFDLHRVLQGQLACPAFADPQVQQVYPVEIRVRSALRPERSLTLADRSSDGVSSLLDEVTSLAHLSRRELIVVYVLFRVVLASESQGAARELLVVVTPRGFRTSLDGDLKSALEGYLEQWLG